MDDAVRGAVEAAIGGSIRSARPVHGGDVAASYRVTLNDGTTIFAKTHAAAAPDFFDTEAAGLRWLLEPRELLVPDVLAVGHTPPFLVLEWIDEAGRADPRGATETAFGASLARLHAAGAPCFGREDRRTTGSRRLPNDPAPTWAEFYRSRRLLPLARLALEPAALPERSVRQLEDVAARLEEFDTAEPPARLHGDLWAGNRLVDGNGRNWLIDPAAHGGSREFDLAMMRLFGGFGPGAYAAYAEVAPLADGWQDRVALHQIAPLVVHAIKFGGGYVGAAADAIGRYA